MNINEVIILISYLVGLFFIMLGIILIIKLKKTIIKIFLLIVILIICVILITMTIIGINIIKDEALPMLVSHPRYEADDYLPYTLSEDQELIISQFGQPNSFLIMFTGESYIDRQETWYFVAELVEVNFINGILINQIINNNLSNINPEQSDYSSVNYIFGLSPGTALNISNIKELLIMPVEEELVKNSQLYYGEDIIFGFVDNELCYVETLLLSED